MSIGADLTKKEADAGGGEWIGWRVGAVSGKLMLLAEPPNIRVSRPLLSLLERSRDT